MVNPFDKTFFKFITGFAVILCISFIILFTANRQKKQTDDKNMVATKSSEQTNTNPNTKTNNK